MSDLNVVAMKSPDAVMVTEHLKFLFGRSVPGYFEITCIRTDAFGGGNAGTRFFDTGEIEEACTYACEMNSRPGVNVYVGAALRKEIVTDDHGRHKAATDAAFSHSYVVFADFDEGQEYDDVKGKLAELSLKPSLVVITGTIPTRRLHAWWALEDSVDDVDVQRATLRGLQQGVGSDPAVCTGKQIMRLGGTLNWPKKDGRELELCAVHKVKGSSQVSLAQLHRAFPAVSSPSALLPDNTVIAHTGSLGLSEQWVDGREAKTFKLVRANLRRFMGVNGSAPDANELFEQCRPVFVAKCSQQRPGRDLNFLHKKCTEAVRDFHRGMIPGARTLEETVANYRARQAEADLEANGDDGETSDEPFSAGSLTGSPPERQWVVHDWVVEGAVNSLYGDGGLGKTLLAQQLACSVSIGEPWLGIATKRGSVLAVLCEDDKDELWRRHNDIKAAMGHPIGNPFDDVWLWPRVGFDSTLVRFGQKGEPVPSTFLESLIEQIERLRPALVILDTLADFYGGSEIDRVQVNYFVKVVLGGLIKDRGPEEPLTVLLLGHPSVSGAAAGGRGFSGSTAWNASVRSRMYLSRPSGEDANPDERILARGKANYAQSGDETGLQLVYADGVLEAIQKTPHGDSMLWALEQEALSEVAHAWRSGDPYTGRKDHPRFIRKALLYKLMKDGANRDLAMQVVGEILKDEKVKLSKSGPKRGYDVA